MMADSFVPVLARTGARAIFLAFGDYRREFSLITRRAQTRFERCDWRGIQLDAVERLELRKTIVSRTVLQLHTALRDSARSKVVWAAMKEHFAALIAGRPDELLAKTFFNSITRIIFTTVGVEAAMEFIEADFNPPPTDPRQPVFRCYARTGSLAKLVGTILSDYGFAVPFQDLRRDARLAARLMARALPPTWGSRKTDRIEMLRPVFYRGKAAYLIGRMYSGGRYIPVVLPILNTGQGLTVDAVLLTENEASIVFSFTRSYFQVEVEQPQALIDFLKSIMPLKRVAELYISIGEHKHGKTELYRELTRRLADTDDRFELAPGDRGMVMMCFTLSSYDVVFKIIKDKFAYPKTATRQEVMDKYALVFKHDRAGRLVDAQEFEHLQFHRSRFAPELLAELMETAANSVVVDGDHVTIRHLYTERRLTPLNLYIRAARPRLAREAVVDYGQAIKDLAATNVFPGDLLLKNFGVTRHGRVVFYDYDELCLVTDCNFRDLPPGAEALDGEASFYVGPADVFPEELLTFLGFPPPLRAVFLKTHGDLLTAEFWLRMQRRHRAGEVMDIFPYRPERRFVNLRRRRVL